MRQFNVVVLGAGGVGKSALTVRFIRDVFVENYDPTIEEEYRRTITVDGELSSLEVLDTAGAEQFTSLNEVYIKSGKGFVLVFSLTQEASLKEVDNLRKQIYRIKGGDTGIPIVVVGTKLDLVNEREVQRSTIQTLASRCVRGSRQTDASQIPSRDGQKAKEEAFNLYRYVAYLCSTRLLSLVSRSLAISSIYTHGHHAHLPSTHLPDTLLYLGLL
ncbi:putative ras subfamily of RAS small GTPases [Lyophyllum shimeji]|uniref:Ras subfamily of RAS small GTPases n=1 Tax=Lyophyllum shimeji TaxID=47721 RepID=A0A9P3PSA9_LYOSH|nr:putative ras subfamily of RAS small GTPases [Lyophyllum shimeji]